MQLSTPPGADDRGLANFLNIATSGFVDSFWGKLGWLEVVIPAYLLWPLVIGSGVLVVLALRRQDAVRLRSANLLLYVVLLTAMVGLQSWSKYRQFGAVAGMQGRYLFPGIVGLLAVLVAGWAPRLARRTPPGEVADDPSDISDRFEVGRREWIRLAAALIPLLVAVLALVFWLRCVYPGPTLGVDFLRWATVVGIKVSALKVIIACGIAIIAGAVCLGVVLSLGFDKFASRSRSTAAPDGTPRSDEDQPLPVSSSSSSVPRHRA